MITAFCVGVILAIFNRIQKLNVRPVFVKVRTVDSKRKFQ
jgi:hypothetical protein